MVNKVPILPQRLRKIPKQFSWLDQRLVRERHIDKLSHPAAALYLFLVTVCDAKGLSFYGDKSIEKRLSMDPDTFNLARNQLIHNELIVYACPIYQVLGLDVPVAPRTAGELISVGQLFKKMAEGNR